MRKIVVLTFIAILILGVQVNAQEVSDDHCKEVVTQVKALLNDTIYLSKNCTFGRLSKETLLSLDTLLESNKSCFIGLSTSEFVQDLWGGRWLKRQKGDEVSYFSRLWYVVENPSRYEPPNVSFYLNVESKGDVITRFTFYNTCTEVHIDY